MVKDRPSIHKAIALSSAEVDVYAATWATNRGKDIQSLGRYFGEDIRVRAHLDALATFG